jgi:hypothetical protein
MARLRPSQELLFVWDADCFFLLPRIYYEAARMQCLERTEQLPSPVAVARKALRFEAAEEAAVRTWEEMVEILG